jgi:hypothetical protein
MFEIFRRVKEAYDWAHFADAAWATLQTKLGYSAVGSLVAMLAGAYVQATWYEILLIGLFVFVAAQTISILRIIKVPKAPIELIFDPADVNCVRERHGLHGVEALRYFIGVRNTTTDRSLEGVILSADDGWFVENTIDIAWGNRTRQEIERIDPHSTKYIELFGLSPNHGLGHDPSTIFGARRRFKMRASGKDAKEATIELEFDPETSPQIKRVS